MAQSFRLTLYDKVLGWLIITHRCGIYISKITKYIWNSWVTYSQTPSKSNISTAIKQPLLKVWNNGWLFMQQLAKFQRICSDFYFNLFCKGHRTRKCSLEKAATNHWHQTLLELNNQLWSPSNEQQCVQNKIKYLAVMLFSQMKTLFSVKITSTTILYNNRRSGCYSEVLLITTTFVFNSMEPWQLWWVYWFNCYDIFAVLVRNILFKRKTVGPTADWIQPRDSSLDNKFVRSATEQRGKQMTQW